MSSPEAQRPDPDSQDQASDQAVTNEDTPGRRPEWLVGAEDLRSPESRESDDVSSGAASSVRLSLVPPASGAVKAEPPAEPKRAWTAAASSIPTLRRDAPPIAAPEFVEPERFESEGRDLEAAFETREAESAPSAPALPPLRESWWLVALDAIRENRTLQIGAAAALLAIAAWTFWPRGEPNVSISNLRRHAREFDSRAVTVHGRVGDVFPMNGGYAFYLRQGRESIVVFTRTRQPVRDEAVSIRGTISTGYLEGAPHQALFETTR